MKESQLLLKTKLKRFTIGRFGSLTFAKRWLVCRAKGNVPNVGRLSAFLSCGSAKKLNLFSFIVISFFIFKPFSQSFSVSLSFLRLVGNVLQLQEVGDFEALNCLPALHLIRSTELHLTTEPPISYRCCVRLECQI